MSQPQTLQEAKTAVRLEVGRVKRSLSDIAGSRWLLAILATLAIAFAAHLAYAPERLPTIGGLSIAQSGLPPSVNFGYAGEKAAEARQAAQNEELGGRAKTWAESNAERIWMINAIGLGLALVLLAINLTIMTKRRWYTKG